MEASLLTSLQELDQSIVATPTPSSKVEIHYSSCNCCTWWKSKIFHHEKFLKVIYKWSVAGELSLDLMQRLSAADLEDMLKVTPPSTHHSHHDEDCRLESTLVPPWLKCQLVLTGFPGLWSWECHPPAQDYWRRHQWHWRWEFCWQVRQRNALTTKLNFSNSEKQWGCVPFNNIFLAFWYTNTKSPLCSLYSEPSWDVYLAYPGKNGGELASLIKMQLEMRGLAVSVDPHDSPCLR